MEKTTDLTKQNLWSRESGEQRLRFYSAWSLMTHHSLGRMCRMFSLNLLQPEPEFIIYNPRLLKRKKSSIFSIFSPLPKTALTEGLSWRASIYYRRWNDIKARSVRSNISFWNEEGNEAGVWGSWLDHRETGHLSKQDFQEAFK